MNTTITRIYYRLKPYLPRRAQLYARRKYVAGKRSSFADTWPISKSAGTPHEGWRGWPGNKKCALVLTHDVETEQGLKKCFDLMNLEERMGFRSSFNLVPEKYNVPSLLRKRLVKRGFELGVHGLLHDGKLYESMETFIKRALRINGYMKEWGSVGFRSPSMHHNLQWLHALDIEYDSSTFDTDPFEPQSDGVNTIFPFVVKGGDGSAYVELPYTLPQDFTIFILMGERDIGIWRRKLDWIADCSGMALINTHPDYMDFDGRVFHHEERYPVRHYEEFLAYIKSNYSDSCWHVLPKEVARYVASSASGHSIK